MERKMRKKWIILFLIGVVLPVLGQETNTVHSPREKRSNTGVNKRRLKRSDWTEQQREEHRERQYQFMEKVLSKIGVNEEDQIKIRKLQETHRQKMRENIEQGNIARKNLTLLQQETATEEEIDAAIQNVADVMAQQLKIIVRNRMEMEKIIGKEKYELLMKNARKQFHKYSRRSGSGLPPHPGAPPIPGKDSKPPLPPSASPPESVALDGLAYSIC